jgi:hypothetical protein
MTYKMQYDAIGEVLAVYIPIIKGLENFNILKNSRWT